nr:hypothetical protein [Micromonospora sp. DSM 115978]
MWIQFIAIGRVLRPAGVARTPVDSLGTAPSIEVAGLPGGWHGAEQRAGIAAALIRLHPRRSRWRLMFRRQAACARCRVPCPTVRPALVVAAAAAARARRSL